MVNQVLPVKLVHLAHPVPMANQVPKVHPAHQPIKSEARKVPKVLQAVLVQVVKKDRTAKMALLVKAAAAVLPVVKVHPANKEIKVKLVHQARKEVRVQMLNTVHVPHVRNLAAAVSLAVSAVAAAVVP